MKSGGLEASTWDVVVLGNGAAAAGAVLRFKERFAAAPSSPVKVLVLDAATEEERARRIPEYDARVSFPADLPGEIPDLSSAVLARYRTVAYYSHASPVRKALPLGRVSLLDTGKLVDLAERDLPRQITVKWHRQAFAAAYGIGRKHIELSIQYPFGDEKVFETTERIRARAVIDCSGTGSLLLDQMQGYRHDSSVVCGVLAFKVLNARVDTGEVSLGLDDGLTHGAGSWAYPNQGLTPAMTEHLARWFATTKNPRVKQLVQGKRPEDFAGTLVDVGISSISPYANAQHYAGNLERQAEGLFMRLPGYSQMFAGSVVVPGSAFYRPSPVLQPVARMGGDRYLLVGDAAGHATPYIGEGIRPGMQMGWVAADLVFDRLASDDLAERSLVEPYEKEWWNRFGHTDVWSDLFRHFSSTCFDDASWSEFMTKLETLTDEEFYRVLRSEYDVGIVAKMFPARLVPHYLRYQLSGALDFALHRTRPRQVASWLR